MSVNGDVAYVDLPPEEARALAASELRGGLAWTVFGIAVLALSWRMDRLEAQHINPYTCLLYTSPSPRDLSTSRMPSSA